MINLIHGVLSDNEFNFVYPIREGKNPVKVRIMRDYSEIYNRYPLLEIDFSTGNKKDTVQVPLSENTEDLHNALLKITDASLWFTMHYYATETIKFFNMLYELEDIIRDNLRDITSILACPADLFALQDKINEIRRHYKPSLPYPFVHPILNLLEVRIKDKLTPAWSALQYAAGRVPRDYPVEVDGFKVNCRWIDKCKDTKYPGVLVETCFLPEEGSQPEKVDLLMSASDKDGKLHYYFDFDEVGYRTFFFGSEAGCMLNAKIRNQLNVALEDEQYRISTGMLLDLFNEITYQNGSLIEPICTFDELDPTTNLSLWLYRFYELTTKQNPDALS
jgi:hypothetical protein